MPEERIDTHCHAGLNWFEPIEALLHQMEGHGVSRAILIQHRGAYDNSYLLECADRHRAHLSVVGMIDPDDPDPLGSLEGLADAGGVGVRVNPEVPFRKCSLPEFFNAADSMGLAISAAGKSKEFADRQFKRILDASGNTRVVLEHLAGVEKAAPPGEVYREALACASWPNVCVKVPGLGEIANRPATLKAACTFVHIPPVLEMAKEAFGVQRMMWGSDFPPCSAREGYGNTIEGIREYPEFDDEDLKWILGETARRFWRLDDQY